MKSETPMTLTLPNSVVDRVDAVADALMGDREVLTLATPTRSVALRLALHLGLEAMRAGVNVEDQQAGEVAAADEPAQTVRAGRRLKSTQPGTTRLSLRLPAHLVEGLDQVVDQLAEDPEQAAIHTRITRSFAIRIALARGLAVAEARYALGHPPRHLVEATGLSVSVE